MSSIEEKFTELYGTEPQLFRSPGRVNLIGEHTDYNEGFVLPAAIDKQMVLAVAENNTNQIRLFAHDFNESFTCPVHDLKPVETGWANYLLGVAAQFQKAGYTLRGFDCVFGGDIPVGAGLSSSAALECGVAFALNHIFELQADKIQLIKYAQLAEHEFAGVMCGIMDQFASVMGKEAHAIRLDCRSLAYEYFPLDLQRYQFILLDTQVKHSLASSEYNTRRQECEQGVAAIRANHPEVKSLRDVTPAMLAEVQAQVPQKVYNRCLYIVEENERLLTGCQLLEQGDIVGFGEKMYGSHDGLSRLYEVSCEELDFLVDFTKDRPEVAGSRMMGGGFGGCTINLILKENKEAFVTAIQAAYKTAFGVEPKLYEVNISDGTSIIS